jgi:hypothetical protein
MRPDEGLRHEWLTEGSMSSSMSMVEQRTSTPSSMSLKDAALSAAKKIGASTSTDDLSFLASKFTLGMHSSARKSNGYLNSTSYSSNLRAISSDRGSNEGLTRRKSSANLAKSKSRERDSFRI